MKTTTKTKSRSHKLQKSRRQKAKQTIRRDRPVHRRVLLHPITVFTLLCVGVFIVSWTFRAAADSIKVTAKVAAPALTEGAIITEPTDGAVFTTDTIMVRGTCPADSYVVLERNNAMSGVAWCAADNTFEIETSLYPGTNTLRAQAYNITDDPGPVTPAVNVTYNPPVATPTNPAAPGKPGATPAPAVNLPLITSSYKYQTFMTDETFVWDIEVMGGTPPYTITTNWGDDTTTTQMADKAQTLQISHQYTKPGYLIVKIKLTDAAGFGSTLQLVAIIKESDSSDFVGSTGGVDKTLVFKNWLVIAWGSYATVLLMAISFWLGERQQVSQMVNRKRITHRHA
jgi:hypothetical protein